MAFTSLLFALPLVASARSISISVNASTSTGNLPSIARFFGCDEPNYAYFPDGEALLCELGHLGPSQTYFRTHNLLTTGDGSPRLKWGSTNAYTEDSQGNPIYNWTIIDRIFDTYLANNVKPYAQIGFMPEALSIHPEPYTFYFNASSAYNTIYTGWSYPPTSWDKWGELVYQWVMHSVERYGKDEVDSWYWEVWNEPNIPYWNGTETQYFELYDYAISAVRRALPTARVGGPEVAGGGTGDAGLWLRKFLDHILNGSNNATHGNSADLDFISFHAKGAPTYINASATVPGHLQMNVSAALINIRDAFQIIHSYPTLRNLPVIIGEDDPDGCAACITDAYGYRNDLIYPSYTAASFVRQLDLAADNDINLEGQLTWAFEYDDHPYFDGFRVLTTNQLDKPILNIFRMFNMMGGQRLMAHSTGQKPLSVVLDDSVRGPLSDVGVFATFNRTTERVMVMIWNYHDDALPKTDVQVQLELESLPSSLAGCEHLLLGHYRIDEEHSNSYARWLAMGSPQQPTEEQYVELKAAGKLQMLEAPRVLYVGDGKVDLSFSLPIHATSLLVLER